MRFRQFLRNASIIVLTTLVVVGIAGAIHQARPPGYTAEAVLVVPSNAAAAGPHAKRYPGPGLEDQAQKLAVTFAGLIPNDQSILQTASARLGRSVEDVQSRLTVVNDANTSIVRIRYEGAHPAEALLGASTVAEAVSGQHPVSPAVPPGALMLIRLPDKTTTSYTIGVLLGVAAVLGLALGLLLVVVRNRVNPPVRTPRELEALVSGPVHTTRWLTEHEIEALLREWRKQAKRSGRGAEDGFPTAALIPTSRRAASQSKRIAARMSSRNGGSGIDSAKLDEDALEESRLRFSNEREGALKVRVPGPGRAKTRLSQRRDLADVEVVGRTRAGRDLDRETLARCDVMVLVVSPGTTTRRVSATVERLDEMARTPTAAIFADGLAAEQPPA